MKGNKIILSLLIASMVLMISSTTSMVMPVQAKAASNVIKLKKNKTYKKYDITGDKKKDKIKVKTVSNASGSGFVKKVTVYVNGKKCLSKTYRSKVKPTIKLIRLKNEKPYLFISALNKDGSFNSGDIYKYRSSKLTSALNLTKLVSKVTSYWDDYHWQGNGAEYAGVLSAVIHKVSGNSIYIRIKHSEWRFGAGDEVYRFDYKGGNLEMYKTFPLKIKKMTIDLAEQSFYAPDGEQIWPFTGGYGTVNQGNVIPVGVTSSNGAIATALINSHEGSGFSLWVKGHKKGKAVITIKAADGRKAKLEVTVI